MKSAVIPQNEEKRLKVLNSYSILDSLPEDDYDAIAKIASGICDTPIALVSLVDEKRQWFKAHHGLEATETPRELAFCAHSILNPNELFIVNDAREDNRFFDNPLTLESPKVVFYAGAPLNTSEGYPLGTLCVIDNVPKELNERQKQSLKLLAKQVVSLLELRKKNYELKTVNEKVTALNEQLNNFAYRLTHDLKSPISGINFLVDVLKEDYINILKDTEGEQYLNLISDRISYIGILIDEILAYSKVNAENIILEEFNLKNLIESILKNIDFDKKIIFDTSNLDVNITSSKIGFVQIFQNLLSNARKFSNKEKVTIDLELKKDENFYYFTLSDDGPGIEKKYREKVFVMFETLQAPNKESTGIGLATVKAIIEKLGGKIEIVNRKDGKSGASFSFFVSVH